jgi:hypothetical protein
MNRAERRVVERKNARPARCGAAANGCSRDCTGTNRAAQGDDARAFRRREHCDCNF